ncbi:MAG: hypothetical protein AB7K52_14280 [Phycisphaerales bacterium]
MTDDRHHQLADNPPDDRDPATGMRTGEKLRTYFLGFGVGLVLVGMLLYARWLRNPPPPPSPPAPPLPAAPSSAPSNASTSAPAGDVAPEPR